MTSEALSVISPDGLPLAGRVWRPEGDPRAVAVFVHGMGEHSRRYDETARAFTRDGYLVYGYDHRGHGDSVLPDRELGDLGPEGWRRLVDDVGAVVDRARAEHPDLPLVLLGHSMGSFAAQQYLIATDPPVDAVVLSGTAALDGLAAAIDPEAGLDLTAFNAPFEPARTEYDWLTRDPGIVDAYVADPLCGFGIDNDSGAAMFAGAAAIADPAQVGRMRSTLPILVAVGEQDPVNGGMALAHLLVEHYRNGGLTDVTLLAYPESRHEILNELDREQVRTDLLGWLAERIFPADD